MAVNPDSLVPSPSPTLLLLFALQVTGSWVEEGGLEAQTDMTILLFNYQVMKAIYRWGQGTRLETNIL